MLEAVYESWKLNNNIGRNQTLGEGFLPLFLSEYDRSMTESNFLTHSSAAFKNNCEAMALIWLVKAQSRAFTTKCSETLVDISNSVDCFGVCEVKYGCLANEMI